MREQPFDRLPMNLLALRCGARSPLLAKGLSKLGVENPLWSPLVRGTVHGRSKPASSPVLSLRVSGKILLK